MRPTSHTPLYPGSNGDRDPLECPPRIGLLSGQFRYWWPREPSQGEHPRVSASVNLAVETHIIILCILRYILYNMMCKKMSKMCVKNCWGRKRPERWGGLKEFCNTLRAAKKRSKT